MIKDGQGKPTDLLCLVCEKAIKVPQYVSANYKGDLVCPNCKSLLHIKLVNSQVAEYEIKKDKLQESLVIKQLTEIRNSPRKE